MSQIVVVGAELILGEFRQLAGAEQRRVAHQQRRADLGVAELVGMQVEHELGERALQPRERALEHDEARAGQLGGAARNPCRPAPRPDLEMLLRREAEARAARRRGAARRWRVSSAPSGTSSAGMLGRPARSAFGRCSAARARVLGLGHAVLERRPRHERRRVLALALGDADLLGERRCAAPASPAAAVCASRRRRRGRARSRSRPLRPRRARPRSKAAGLSQIHLTSNMGLSVPHPRLARMRPRYRARRPYKDQGKAASTTGYGRAALTGRVPGNRRRRPRPWPPRAASSARPAARR